MDVNVRGICGALAFVAVVVATVAVAEQGAHVPRPKLIQIDPSATQSNPLLSGPPETVTMRSGSVVLLPSKNVGRHGTGQNEEALVVFSGTGEMRLADGTVLKLKPYVVAYCPPATEHDVFNTGSEPLRYVYVVARAR
jgi:mannose-6-phosphate isomerase-like protein (cupin superfamily)